MKGKRLPVQALPLLGRRRGASRFPLIGRDDDLAQLELVARRAFTDRRPFLVSLIAPAGTGKTSWSRSSCTGCPASRPMPRWRSRSVSPYGQRVTYWPLRALLVRLVGLKDEARRRPCARRSGHGSDRGVDRPSVRQTFSPRRSAPVSRVIDRAALFAAWRTAIEVAARRSPLVWCSRTCTGRATASSISWSSSFSLGAMRRC